MSTHTLAEIRRVMQETQVVLDRDDRQSPVMNARASATQLRPPEFSDIIVRLQTENPDWSLPEAVRAAAIEEPTLHKKWVEKENTKMQIAEQEKKDSAARSRARRR